MIYGTKKLVTFIHFFYSSHISLSYIACPSGRVIHGPTITSTTNWSCRHRISIEINIPLFFVKNHEADRSFVKTGAEKVKIQERRGMVMF